MSIIIRYLLRQFLGPLMVCLIAFNGIFILFDLFGHLSKFIDSELTVLEITQYYLGLICMYCKWFMPASCMLATLYTMWNLSHHNELTAMRASGISFHRLTTPFFMVALFLSLLSFATSEFLSPWVADWSDRLKENDFKTSRQTFTSNVSYINSETHNQWTFSQLDTSSEHGFRHVTEPLEIKRDSDGINVWGVRADGAEYMDGIWWLKNAKFLKFDIDGSELPTDDSAAIPLPSLFPFSELSDHPRDMFNAMRNWEFLGVADMFLTLKNKDKQSDEKWFDLWYALAAPWTCIVITLFAIPAGITTGRQSVFKGIALVLATFFGFYAFTLLLKFLGQDGLIPPLLAAWLPNIIFLGFGAVLYRRLT